MYCRKCYAPLEADFPEHRCLRCGRPFDPAKRRTYLSRPFPGVFKIIAYIVVTTMISGVVASIVALFQSAAASGH